MWATFKKWHFNTGTCGYALFKKNQCKIALFSPNHILEIDGHFLLLQRSLCQRNPWIISLDFYPVPVQIQTSFNWHKHICHLTTITAVGIRHWIFILPTGRWPNGYTSPDAKRSGVRNHESEFGVGMEPSAQHCWSDCGILSCVLF